VRTELTSRLLWIGGMLRKTGPYLALEILMPGGTLLALALFLYQRRRAAAARNGAAPGGAADAVTADPAASAARALVVARDRVVARVRTIGSGVRARVGRRVGARLPLAA
jgi:hypothetical protein